MILLLFWFLILITFILGLNFLFSKTVELTLENSKDVLKEKNSEQFIIKTSSITDKNENLETYKSNAIDIKIKDNDLDTARIIEYTGDQVKLFQWYPQTFNQFIGQEEAKAQAKTIIAKMNKHIKCHVLLSAIQGHGKSSFVKLLAKELHAHYIERIGKQINEDNIIDIINEINTSSAQNIVFFLDETDTCDWKILKLFNPILQDFKISNKKIKPFMFCGATINKDILIQKTPDLLDRISHQIQFKRYNEEEIIKILTQYQKQLYENETISQKIYETISKNCKFNPRLSINLLEDYIVTENITKTLKDRRIIYQGLTDVDIKILQILNNSKKALGANALSQRVGLSQSQYIREYEPYLCEFGYIIRTPSRTITEVGKEILKSI